MNFQELIDQLFANSWRAAILIAALFAFRGVLRRFLDARVIYWFWVLVALRLLLPFDVHVSVSAARYLPQVPWTDATAESLSVYGSVPVDSSGDRSLREILFNEKYLAAIWLGGVGVVLLASVVANVSFRRQLSRSGRRAGKRTEQAVSSCSRAMGLNPIPVLEMDALSGPALFGVWRPRLLFPLGLADQLSDEELRLVVLHELGHLKRRDLFLQGLLVVSQAVHWFNPLVWLAGRLAREDRELACDEFVMAHTSHSGSHAYAKTLLRVLGLSRPGRPMLPAVGILETKNQIKQRIIMITKYQSTNARRIMLGAASILAVSAGLLMVNAAESGSNASAASSPETSDAQLNSSRNPKAAIGDPKAEKIIIPKINFTDVSVEKALEFLRAKSRELDPEKKGVEIILKDYQKSKDTVITLSMDDMPLFDAVKYVGEAANLDVNWVGKAIVLTSRADVESYEGSTPDDRKTQASNPDVLARVNDVAITIDQVNSVVGKKENEIRQKFTGEERDRQIAEARKQALNDLINRELLLQDFRSHGYSITEQPVDYLIDETIRTEFSGNRASFLTSLEKQGYTLDAYKEILRDQIRVQAMRQSIVKGTQDAQQREQKLNEWFASARKNAAITMY